MPHALPHRVAIAAPRPLSGLNRRCLILMCAAGLLLASGMWWRVAAADAAVQSFSLSPSSGPPGTTVHVSGTSCAPGVLVSPSQDFVEVSSATLIPTSTRFAVSASGSWNGTFVVPAGAPALPAAISAVCFSDGLQSLQTIYLPGLFTVTAASTTTVAPSPTTTKTTPTTQAHPGTTRPGAGTPGGVPATVAPGDSGSSPSDPVATPGDGTIAIFDGITDRSPGGNSSVGTHPTTPPTSATRAGGGTKLARSADLSGPRLDVSGGKRSGGLGWLLWLLVVVLIVALLALAWSFRWIRRHARPEPTATDLS
jgi:hypothetical protein